jgi:hypothetical protein
LEVGGLSGRLKPVIQGRLIFMSVDPAAFKAVIQRPLVFVSVDPSALQAVRQKQKPKASGSQL